MNLLLDIGNSSVNWAKQEQEAFISSGVFSYTKTNFEKEIIENLSSFEKPSNVLVSNVAGDSIFILLNDWTKEHWQQDCWQPCVSTHYKELTNSYEDTEQMGLDRWLAMIAAWEMNQTALCLVGCGTALTIDLIDASGKHSGGYIIPGIELMQKTLVDNTVQINTNIRTMPSIEYAQDTQTAVNNGSFLAAVSIIDHTVKTFSDESNSGVKCIMSGGMASSIKSLLNHPFEYEPNLVLMGLSMLHKARQ
ncbi:MAG: type III pantothenate kinase [Proteobacteria bacterium]|nr:type III pantothenate kinase [Pseudomonadota bacterium]NOG61711.1 type III pantothenate kinase [Pseudomonadota bacterium]